MTDNTAISFCYIHNLRNSLLQLGIKDGDEIIVSYYIKTDSTTFTDSIIGNMECLRNKVDLENPAISNDWQRVSYKGTFSTTTTYQAMYIVPNKTYSTLASNEHIYISSIKIEKGNKVTYWSPNPEDVDNMIAKTVKQVDVEYYLSTSSSSATGGSWSTTAPAWVDGKYMWSRQKVTYVDDTTATRNETCIAGAKGATGSPGGTGATGTGVESITEEYYLSTSKSSQTGGSWVTTPPIWSTGKYIWTRSKIVYKNPASTVYTTPVCSSEWEAVNNVNVGGTNLILKSSFLYDTEPTDKNWSTCTVNNINYRRFTVNGYEYKAAADNGAINSSVGLRVSLAELGLKIGDTISISYDIKGKMGTINNGLAVMHATAASSNFYAKIYAKVNGAAHPTSIPDWTRVKGTWTIDSDFPSNNDYIYIFFGGGTGSEIDLFVRNVKVEKGNKPTEWSPAPKDVDNLVTDSIDNIQVGGTNRIIGSIKYREDTPYKIENATANDSYRILTDLKVTPIPGEWYILQVKCDKPVSPRHGYAGDTKGKFALFLYLRNIGSTQPDGSFDVAQQFTGTSNYETLKYLGNKNNTYYWSYKIPNNTRDIIVRVNTYASTDEPVTISWWDFKMEQGNKPTDWTPAPEDVDSSIGDVQTIALGAQSAVEAVDKVANQASVDIESIKGYIQNLVVDQNGQSMMTQTGEGWQFNMGPINGNLNSLSKAVDDMSDDNEDTKAILNNVKSLAESIADKTAYINVDYTTDASGNPIPRMILGAETSAFKIRITNESIDFMESDTVMAYATSNTFYNLTTVVQKELEIGSGPSFVWTVRSNGNLGLTYKS